MLKPLEKGVYDMLLTAERTLCDYKCIVSRYWFSRDAAISVYTTTVGGEYDAVKMAVNNLIEYGLLDERMISAGYPEISIADPDSIVKNKLTKFSQSKR